jgi:hypothetical protein
VTRPPPFITRREERAWWAAIFATSAALWVVIADLFRVPGVVVVLSIGLVLAVAIARFVRAGKRTRDLE